MLNRKKGRRPGWVFQGEEGWGDYMLGVVLGVVMLGEWCKDDEFQLLAYYVCMEREMATIKKGKMFEDKNGFAVRGWESVVLYDMMLRCTNKQL
jgi:hypothetical protein